MIISKLLAPALAGALLMSQALRAEETPAQASTEQVAAAIIAIPYRGDIAAVNAEAKTFTLKGKSKERTFAITTLTKLSKDNTPAAWEDLKIGEHVSGRAIKKAEGKYEAVSVKLGIKPEAAKPEAQ